MAVHKTNEAINIQSKCMSNCSSKWRDSGGDSEKENTFTYSCNGAAAYEYEWRREKNTHKKDSVLSIRNGIK